jgi:peroxiredoxin
MKTTPAISTLIIALLMITTLSYSPIAHASDLSTAANIFMFPRPQQVAEMLLKNPTGKIVSLRDYRGKVVLLHFWSISCPACKYEEPFLDQLKRTFEPMGLAVLGVNLIDPPESVVSHASACKLPFSVLFDGGKGFRIQTIPIAGRSSAFVINPANEAILNIPALPTTYILDCRGSAVGYSIGAARWNHASAVRLIQGLLAESRTCPRLGPVQSQRISSLMSSLW